MPNCKYKLDGCAVSYGFSAYREGLWQGLNQDALVEDGISAFLDVAKGNVRNVLRIDICDTGSPGQYQPDTVSARTQRPNQCKYFHTFRGNKKGPCQTRAFYLGVCRQSLLEA